MKKKSNTNIVATIKKVGAVAVLLVLLVVFVRAVAGASYAVTWGIQSFESDIYNIQDLTFVWGDDTGTATNLERIGCALGSCTLETTYETPGNHTVSVFAKNAQGQQVSNIASCSADVYDECPCDYGYTCVNNRCVYGMEASCAAYASLTSQNPTLFFNPGTTVYWKPTLSGGTPPYTYSWNIQTQSDTVQETTRNAGPFYVADIGDTVGDYLPGEQYVAELAIRDGSSALVNVSCSMNVKQCQYDSDCQTLGFPSSYYCNQSTFTCVPPDPIFVQTLIANPGVVNEGQQCSLAWESGYATRCDVYRNNNLYQPNVATTTTDFKVNPGTYHVQCINEVNETITAGPTQCIYNPQIRES